MSRLDCVTFELNGTQIEVAWYAALDIRDRLARAEDPIARGLGERVRARGASRPVVVETNEIPALLVVLQDWNNDVTTVLDLQDAAKTAADSM